MACPRRGQSRLKPAVALKKLELSLKDANLALLLGWSKVEAVGHSNKMSGAFQPAEVNVTWAPAWCSRLEECHKLPLSWTDKTKTC